jgi:prepilin-type N-terminal cleavage/methylation domain-containing protein
MYFAPIVTSKNFRMRRHRAFTLIELLLVIAVIAILASLSLVVINDANYQSQWNATQNRVNQIDRILKTRLEGYEVRRVPLNNLLDYIDRSPNNDGRNAQHDVRVLKRRIIADIISAEMPQSLSDVINASNSFPSQPFIDWATGYSDLQASPNPPQGTGNNIWMDLGPQVPAAALRFNVQNQQGQVPDDNSELLYIILETTQFNGIVGTAALGSRAFGDTDGDGFPEVLDVWGNPITFSLTGLTADDNFDVTQLSVRIISTGRGIEPCTNF